MNRATVHSRGFSLTELLVAMVIGLLLLGGLVTLMVNSKKNYAQQDYSARLQENARFAVDFLSYDIRMAGYYGCFHNSIANDDSVQPIVVSGPPTQVTITYGEASGAGNQVILDPANHDPDSDTELVVNFIPEDWEAGDALVISDCLRAAAADIDTGGIDENNNTITVTPRNGDLEGRFDPSQTERGPITVRRLISNTYTIATTGASGIPVLTRNGQELVEGVESIRLLYQDSPGAAFSAASGGSDNPTAVQLGLLVRSVSNENLDDREYGSGVDLTEDDGQHPLLGQVLDLNTLRGQRRTFTTTLVVRNRPR